MFNGNGADSGSTASMSMTYDVSKNLTENGFVRTSYKFKGWNTKADGSGTTYANRKSVKNLTSTNGATVNLYAIWEYDPVLLVNECDVYDGGKGTITKLYGISRGNVFDDYEYKTDYPTIGNTVWYNIYFPKEKENIKVRQYVKCGGDWITRDVTLNSTASSQWFPVQFADKYKTINAGTSYFQVQAKMDWIDADGNVLKSGSTKTFHIPIKPVVYRTQVKAVGYEGTTVAYDGKDSSSGKLYSGQRINISYRYTADSTWSACEYLRATMYNYNGSAWEKVYKENDGYDASKNKVNISKAVPVNLNSAIGKYTVPVTSQNKLRFYLQSWWNSDKTHTLENTWYELPVVKSDVALSEIILVDATTKATLDPNSLEAGQNVLVRYKYKNNTAVKVYVEGFKNDESQISGVFAIPANGSITVDGYTFTVPNKREISIWGGVYLEGMGIRNTTYESNGNNNAKTLSCKVNHPLTLTPIAQNAHYRENTEVVTSFWINNSYSDKYHTGNSDIRVKFKVYNGSNLITTYTRYNVEVPAYENNLVYFKWRVPTGLNGSNVKITGEIIDGGVSYNLNGANYNTTPYVTSVTPDTQFEKKAPSGFTVKQPPSANSTVAVWWEWESDGAGNFTKKTYGLGITNSSFEVTPQKEDVATRNGLKWIMGSGYGFNLTVYNGARYISGYETATADAFTLPQFAITRHPEFEYSLEVGKCRTLELNSGKWNFPTNGSYGKTHFTPLWYPDGDYTLSVTWSDMWTPAGVITKTENKAVIKITDSAYDDWHIQH